MTYAPLSQVILDSLSEGVFTVDPDWKITADSEEQVYFDLSYHFLKYERKHS